MTQRSKWAAIPGLLALAVGAVVLSAYSGASSSQGRGPITRRETSDLRPMASRASMLFGHWVPWVGQLGSAPSTAHAL